MKIKSKAKIHSLQIKESLLITKDKQEKTNHHWKGTWILHLCVYLIKFPDKLVKVSLFNLIGLFTSKFHHKTLQKKLLITIKHDLIIGRDMP